jgi:UDP-2-acetamido-3-amino-2,3-dideoxy-glucuronate N-acetyltransferase
MNFFKHESSYIDSNCSIGARTKIWHFSHLSEGCIVGSDCVLGQNVFIGKGVVVGDRVKIQNNVSVYSGVTVEDGVFLGPGCVFTNVINPRSELNRKDEFKPTLLRKGATIGANATVVCGLSIGEYAFIGAGAVVTHDVPAYGLVVGNPARLAGWVSRAGLKLAFDADGIATCPQTGEKYVLNDNIVKHIA